MTRSIRRRLLVPVLAIGLGGTFAAPAAAQGDVGQTTEPFIPFVTDFGRSSFSTPTTWPATSASSSETAGGLDWSDAAIGAALGFGAAAVLGAAGAVVRSRRRSGWPLPEEARQTGA